MIHVYRLIPPPSTHRQGSRTPHTDPLARGAFVGLTLSHTRAHIFRAILESVCYGTRSCLDALEASAAASSSSSTATVTVERNDSGGCDDVVDGSAMTPPGSDREVIIAGGATRSELWLQLHADVTGRTFVINENTDGPLLGCAILASVGAGIYPSVDEAVRNMVRRERKIEPRPEVVAVYDRLYEEVYSRVRPGVRDVFHALAELRGGGRDDAASDHGDDGNRGDNFGRELGDGSHVSDEREKKSRLFPHGRGKRVGKWGIVAQRHGIHRGGAVDDNSRHQLHDAVPPKNRPIISPSLLACDW